jgi:hypothetical protein
VVTAITATYVGPCPPPSDATLFKANVTVNKGPVILNLRWHTDNNGDSDPNTYTITFPGTGEQTLTVTHSETGYQSDTSFDDHVVIVLWPFDGSGPEVVSRPVAYTMTCVAAPPSTPSA